MNSIQVLATPQDLIKWRQGLNGSVGFVPTMGALHEGHGTLMRQAAQENDHSILSIFVNPTQFNDKKDLEKYPRTLEADLEIAQSNGITAVFTPNYETMYSDGYRYKITESEFSKILCGAHRPGHFDGVLTVVMKLLNLAKPDRAYFGEKDYQQLQLIKDMVESFFLPYQIVPVPTVRESDGLAMSSRNVRLTPEQRAIAPCIYKALQQSVSADAASALLAEKGFKVDYVLDYKGRRYCAAFLGDVRLIDNVQI